MSARGTKSGERQSDRGRSGQDSRGSRNSREQKRYVVSLTGKGLAMSCLLGLVALVWVFIFGVFLGRGMRPENFMPELSRFLPDRKPPPPPMAGAAPAPVEKTADKAPEKAVAATSQPAPAPSVPAQPAPALPPSALPPSGLPTEDKEVRRKAAEVAKLVEGQTSPAAQKPAPATPPAAPAPSSPDKRPPEAKSQDPKAATAKPPEAKPQDAKSQDAKGQDTKLAATKARPGATLSEDKTDGRVYEFVYQIGSFEKDKGAEEMKALKARCKSAGMSTAEEEAVVEGRIMKRLRVTHVGTVESSLALKEKLAGMGVKNPLLTSKKPL